MANKPTNPQLYSRVKAEAKKKFDRWPSAYGSAWLVKEYKRRGGGYRTAKDGINALPYHAGMEDRARSQNLAYIVKSFPLRLGTSRQGR